MNYSKETYLLIAAWMLMFPVAAVHGETASCDGVVIDAATKGIEVERADPVDVYITSRMRIKPPRNSFFKVYRPKTVREEAGRSYVLRLYLGRLQVIDVQDDLLIGRMIEFASEPENPRVRYETFMVGDCLLLEYDDRPLEIPAEKLVPEPLDLPEIELNVPAEIPVVRSAIPTKVLFDFDSAHIEDKWNEELDRLAEFIKERDPVLIVVEGHTCSIGSEEYNLRLSRRRAQAVIDFFTSSHGIPKDLFRIRAYGESRPEVSNEIEEGRQQNRRAATLILYEAATTKEMRADRYVTVTPEFLVPEDTDVPLIRRETATEP